MTKKWKFSITESRWLCEPKKGKKCWHADIQQMCEGYYGHYCAFDTREEAEQMLYRTQDERGIADTDIEWIGAQPRIIQMELF